MVLFSSSKCNVSRLRKTSVYDRKKLASIKIVHKGVKSEFLKKHYFLFQRSSLTFAGRLSTAEKGTYFPFFKMAGEKNRNATWATVLSLLELITTFQ